jgi:hypothetical protein
MAASGAERSFHATNHFSQKKIFGLDRFLKNWSQFSTDEKEEKVISCRKRSRFVP